MSSRITDVVRVTPDDLIFRPRPPQQLHGPRLVRRPIRLAGGLHWRAA